MKKTISFITLAVVLLACSKTAGNGPSAEGGRLSTRISLMEALGHMNGLVDQLNGADTKSSFSKSYSMDKVFSVCHIPTVTKSGESEDAADTMMYVVNFDNDEGFAVLAADSRMPADVLCITEKGHMSEELFAAAKEALEGDGATDDSLWVPMLLLASAERTRANGVDPGDPGLIGGGPGGIIGPYVHTKWNQVGSPYDSLVPGPYAGCVIVAVAQIMAFEQYASTMTFNGVPCTWSAMKTVYTYPNASYGGTTAGRSQVANFLYELGKPANCNATYNAGGSPASDSDARKTLLNYGYSNVTLHYGPTGFTDVLHSIVRNQLFAGHPAYCGGMINISSGHVWVIDGYFAGLYHINWGWGGYSDGYYTCGVFDTSQRDSFASIDSGYEMSDAHFYTFGFVVITYSR